MSESPAANPIPPSTLTARASNTVRNKNLILILMFLIATVWFGFDGFYRYTLSNDSLAKRMLDNPAAFKLPIDSDPNIFITLQQWPEWRLATHDQKTVMYELTRRYNIEGFHSELDIQGQQLITACLLLASLGTLWWFFHCQRRRVIADESSLSPSPGTTIPWNQIKTVDNSLWQKKGYVFITYTSDSGAARKATLDDYIVDRAPLIEILKRIEQQAHNAEFLPKPTPEFPAA